MNSSNLSQLKIDPDKKRRPGGSVKAIFIVITLAIIAAAYFAWPRPEKDRRIIGTNAYGKDKLEGAAKADPTPKPASSEASGRKPDSSSDPRPSPKAPGLSPAAKTDTVLTVSGYIINRERIEISPRFQGMVKWIGVKKGDTVSKDQVVVTLDDAEHKARVTETEGRLANAKVALARAELNHRRITELWEKQVVTQENQDDTRLSVESARAVIQEVEGQLALAKTYLDWTIIKSPINGVVLEKLVEPGELVTPQSFGGTRGPSTALIAVADPTDLQVELDVNESDLAKITLGQPCRVSPEAYPDRSYPGIVAEISPEANRQKGTLQIKVGIKNPDKYLTPELTAKVDILAK